MLLSCIFNWNLVRKPCRMCTLYRDHIHNIYVIEKWKLENFDSYNRMWCPTFSRHDRITSCIVLLCNLVAFQLCSFHLFQGLTGLLQSPIKGAEKHGLPGVLSGIITLINCIIFVWKHQLRQLTLILGIYNQKKCTASLLVAWLLMVCFLPIPFLQEWP